MPDLVIIFGPPACGKAAIGHELAKLTGFRFFHNHMTAEPVAALFGWDTPMYSETAAEIRLLLLSKALDEDGSPSIIFTFVWAFDLDTDNLFISQLVSIAKERGRQAYFVELTSSREARMAREGTPFRLQHKPAKRDVQRARALHAKIDAKHKMNSEGDFPYPSHHVIIDTEAQEPLESARMIAGAFGFSVAS